MNIIYLHGFQSSALSVKGQQFAHYCQHQTSHQVYLPDLNIEPAQALAKLSRLIEQLENVALLGSSLGGFYATQLVAEYAVPAVLINPAMRPWQLFRNLFGLDQIPYFVNEQWSLDAAQLDYLEQVAVPFVQNADKILVLLQEADEVLDYREAQRYYSAHQAASLIITEMHGSHAMENFSEKIPMIIEFLSHWQK